MEEEKNNIEWRPVKGYEGLYEVSNFGDVRNVKTQNILKPDKKRGYNSVLLKKRGYKNKWFLSHRLVAMAFIGEPCGERICVNHIDGNKTNNFVENLEWVTHKENTQHAIRTGLRKPCSEVQKEKFSKMMYERWSNEEYRNRVVKNMRGKVRTPEYCKKLSEAALKQETYKVINLTTGEIFNSAREAAQKYGRTTEAIRMCLYGKSKTCAKCEWEVYND